MIRLLLVRTAGTAPASAVLGLPVSAAEVPQAALASAGPVTEALAAPVRALLAEADQPGRAGTVHELPRPGHRPARLLLFGIGDGGEAGWRAAGAALARAARRDRALSLALPPEIHPAAVRGLAEGLWLASYRFRLAADPPGTAPRLRQVTLGGPDRGPDPAAVAAAVATARATAEATCFARDLTNTPSLRKNPAWFARQVRQAAARYPGVTVTVRDPKELAAEGFGGILAVGGGSVNGPRLVELSWRPGGADRHVVLVGKGITFDSGGISIKTRDGMRLMRKDMGGAAAIVAATLGAAALRLPVQVTALAALAENMPSGSSYRPGDVVRHYGGMTTEIQNTDAEGRLVVADALAYASSQLRPDVLVDLATLTGANAVALGKRTAALYSEDDALAKALAQAAAAAGEQVWRLPLPADYVEYLGSDVADVNQHAAAGADSVFAALYLREFTGAARARWAHLDMSAPSWSELAEAELAKGATGWGVRTLLRWLAALSTGEPAVGGPAGSAAHGAEQAVPDGH